MRNILKSRLFVSKLKNVALLLGLQLFASSCDAGVVSVETDSQNEQEVPVESIEEDGFGKKVDLRNVFKDGDFHYRLSRVTKSERIAFDDLGVTQNLTQSSVSLCRFLRSEIYQQKGVDAILLDSSKLGEIPDLFFMNPNLNYSTSVMVQNSKLNVRASEFVKITAEIDLSYKEDEQKVEAEFMSQSFECYFPSKWKVYSYAVDVIQRADLIQAKKLCHSRFVFDNSICTEESLQFASITMKKHGKGTVDIAPQVTFQWILNSKKIESVEIQQIVAHHIGASEMPNIEIENFVQAAESVDGVVAKAIAMSRTKDFATISVWALPMPHTSRKSNGGAVNRFRAGLSLLPLANAFIESAQFDLQHNHIEWAASIDTEKMLGSNFMLAWDVKTQREAVSLNNKPRSRFVGDYFYGMLSEALEKSQELYVHFVWSYQSQNEFVYTRIRLSELGEIIESYSVPLDSPRALGLPAQLSEL